MRTGKSASPRRRIPLLAALAVAAALAVLWWPTGEDPGAVSPAESWPTGRWHLDAATSGGRPPGGETGDDDLARTLSLPYAAGHRGGGGVDGRTGVTLRDLERAGTGWNLYVSGHAPEARLIDMDGRTLHRWRYPFERLFPGRAHDGGGAFFRRAEALPDGGLLAIFQGYAMIRLDRESRLLWKREATFFNHLWVGRDGRIFSIVKQARLIPDLHPSEPVLEDFVVILSPGGEILERISLLAALRDSDFAHLLEPRRPAGDIFHTNTVSLLEHGGPDPFRAGRLLVSLRELDIVAVIDPETRRCVWARRGPWRRQHEPTLLADGHLLVFDNRGHEGYSRVVEFDPESDDVAWTFGGDPPAVFSSPEAGTAARLESGNTLITESERGRAFEVTRDGTVVWEFVSPHRAGPNGELVATLFELERIEPSFFAPGAIRKTP